MNAPNTPPQGPYSYKVVHDREGISHRVHDGNDNRIATCYEKENAQTIVAALNAARSETVTIDAEHAAMYRFLRSEGLLDGHVFEYEAKHDLDESDTNTHDYCERCDTAIKEVMGGRDDGKLHSDKPQALYVWLVPSEEVLEQPGSWRIRKWYTAPFPEANFTLASQSATAGICHKCKGSGEMTVYDTTRGPDGEDHTIACDQCSGTGADVPLCDGHAASWFTERNHLTGDHRCVVCAFAPSYVAQPKHHNPPKR